VKSIAAIFYIPFLEEVTIIHLAVNWMTSQEWKPTVWH